MPVPRATSSDADELAATISAVKSRLNEMESSFGVGNAPVGSITEYVASTAPIGWSLCDGGTIVNGRYLYPFLWSILPATYKSGNNIVKPTLGPTSGIYKIIRLI